MKYIEPKSIPSALLKKLSSFCLPHTEFIKVAQNSFDDAKSLIISNSKTLQRERNLGLARLALTALKRKRIKILATVYKTLTIEKLAQLSHFADVSDVQHVLLDMVNKGEICAEFDKETNIVTFFDEQEPDASVNLMKKLREKVSASHSFLTDLRKMADSASSDLSFMQMIANLDLYFNLDGATSSLGTK